MMAPPVLKDDHVLGICAYGELRCLRLSDGKEAVEHPRPDADQAGLPEGRAPPQGSPGRREAAAGEAPCQGRRRPARGRRQRQAQDEGRRLRQQLPHSPGRQQQSLPHLQRLRRSDPRRDQPGGYHEVSRTKLIEPNHPARGRDVVWSHPAFADKCIFARNDKEIICVPLSAN